MRHLDGQEFFTIGEVSAAVGVSQQTLRVWEAKSLLSPVRTSGGQRLYSKSALERARQVARLRRDTGWNPAAIATALAARPDDSSAHGLPRHGANLRRARRARGLTLKELAARVGVAAGTLSALERGEGPVSSAIISRLADALLVPMSALASSTAPHEEVIRQASRPRTVNKGNVVWEELGPPGRDMEPALLTVPPGEDSGGTYSRQGETFALVLEGSLTFTLPNSLPNTEPRELALAAGDAITIPARAMFAWLNTASCPTRLVWVECLAASAPTTPSAVNTINTINTIRHPGPDQSRDG